ncbi:MAG: 30S ribosomal protein S2 [Candidatus Lokiarchaeota archaeon]|nr:30S ribosomal protein S2 [Candidatus Lokiarchaeota archaeon]MBD3200118.1 30S ribosomal protein S2 [Candidatus Lokiarchaeota archaeon]
MARKKKKSEEPEDIDDLEEEDSLSDLEEDFAEELDEDIDLEEELDLLDTDDISVLEEEEEPIFDKDEETKQLYLSCGIHIGTKLISGDFKERGWLFRATNYGLYVIDLTQTEERIKIAAKFLSKYVEEGSDKVIVSSVRRYGKEPVRKFCEALGCRAIVDRFIPGSLTNPNIGTYIKDASVVVIVDPHADKVILREAKLARIPVVSLFDTDDNLKGIDLAIPANNRGKKALGLAFWILAREILLELGKIASEDDFPYSLDDFTSNIVPMYKLQEQ